MLAELEKLEANLGGVADMRRQPDAVFIVDLRKEQLAVREARRLGIPVIALVDTNCDPDEADYVIPGNDDAIRSCSLLVRAIADGVDGRHSERVAAQEFVEAARRGRRRRGGRRGRSRPPRRPARGGGRGRRGGPAAERGSGRRAAPPEPDGAAVRGRARPRRRAPSRPTD